MCGRIKVVSTIFILIVFSFCLPHAKGNGGYLDATVSEAKPMIDSNPLLVILDVRTRSEYDSGHIRNAKLIPHTELEAGISELNENRETLVYCRSGVRSAVASQILVDHGFEEVYNMLGGILAWIDADYPVYVRYSSIQQAINKASDEETIFVSSGTYLEHLVVSKSLTLVGENRDTTIIDGGGTGNVVSATVNSAVISDFTMRGSGCGCAGYSGIRLQGSHNSCITGNIITHNGYGIQLRDSNGCTISFNIVANNGWDGIELDSSHRNIIASNDIRENRWGFMIRSSSDNVFYHNSVVDNAYQTSVADGFSNTWDNSYSSGGNYWSDYIGVDLHRGPYQNETGSDGIGDTPYIINVNNQDNFPLMNPYIPPEELRVLFYELLEKYSQLQSHYYLLNSTFHNLLLNYTGLQEDYDSLQNDYDSLQEEFDWLNSTYNNLNTTYNELKSKQEATINELNNIRNLMYTFIVTTIILIATTVYFMRRKSKS